jgi:hypothetical protein
MWQKNKINDEYVQVYEIKDQFGKIKILDLFML